MFKPLSRPLLALALVAALPALAQQPDAGRQKELDEARADLQRAARRVTELSRGAGDLRMPIHIDQRIVSRPRLGVLLSGDDAAGVRITGVTPESGAAKAGLKAGDRLLRVADEPVRGDNAEARVAHARELLTDLKVDAAVRITYQRDGKTHDASVTPTRVSPRIAFSGDGPRSVFLRSGDDGMPQIEDMLLSLDSSDQVISPDVQRELRQLGRLGGCKGEECRVIDEGDEGRARVTNDTDRAHLALNPVNEFENFRRGSGARQRHDRVVAAAREGLGDDREFPAAGDPQQGRLVDPQVVQGAQRAVHQAVHHLLVPLRRDDGDPQVPDVPYRQLRCALAAHVLLSPRCAYWLLQVDRGAAGAWSSHGRSCPIRSRLVRR